MKMWWRNPDDEPDDIMVVLNTIEDSLLWHGKMLKTIINNQALLITKIEQIERRETIMNDLLNTLSADVDADVAEMQAAMALIVSLVAELAANVNDPVAVHALADKLTSSTAALKAVVDANTPAPVVAAAPVEVAPAPVEVAPAPVEVAPTPVEAAPVEAAPAPVPVVPSVQ